MNQAKITASITSPTSESDYSPEVIKFKIAIEVIGIKKRCRKSERHFFQVSSIPYNDGKYDETAINQLVRDFLDVNMKEVNSQVRVNLDHVKIRSEGLFISTLWEPFSSLNVRYNIQY